MKLNAILSLAVMIMFSAACTRNKSHSSDQPNNAADSAAIAACFKQQLNSWNEGDIEGFMKYYWNSDRLQFITIKGVNRGWDRVLENYQRAFPNKEAMGRLEFKTDEYRALGNQLYHTTGQWVVHQQDSFRSGYFSLIWKYFPEEGWRIIIDHTW
jgi:ketosteroid isomerase-like protein